MIISKFDFVVGECMCAIYFIPEWFVISPISMSSLVRIALSRILNVTARILREMEAV